MPIIDCKLISGYTENTRKLLSERITDAACSSTGAGPEFVTVTITEISPNNYMRGRAQKKPAKAQMQSDEIILNYLKAMETRDLELANSFISADFQIICPGNVVFNTLKEFLSWGKIRYRKIGKEIDSLDLSFNGLEACIYCHGTLKGEWLSGKPFKGIRFIDKFQTLNSKIVSQEIWNDLDVMKES